MISDSLSAGLKTKESDALANEVKQFLNSGGKINVITPVERNKNAGVLSKKKKFDVSKEKITAVINFVKTHDGYSRSEIADHVGFSTHTVSPVCRMLADKGVFIEVG